MALVQFVSRVDYSVCFCINVIGKLFQMFPFVLQIDLVKVDGHQVIIFSFAASRRFVAFKNGMHFTVNLFHSGHDEDEA